MYKKQFFFNYNWKIIIDNPGHLNLIRATLICQSLARMGHQLSKLNDTPESYYTSPKHKESAS